MLTPYLEKSKNKRKRTREWLNRRHDGKGILQMLNDELLNEDPVSYRNFLRLTGDVFEKLLKSVESDIAKADTVMRDSVSARSR